MNIQIGVIGAGTCSDTLAEVAQEIGYNIAKRGAILVCGGLGGVMEAAAHGAKLAGGTTIGILPGYNKEDANPYVDIVIVTGISHARNVLVVRSSDAIIAMKGSYGTLSEIAFALKMEKPIITIKGYWNLDGMIIAENPRAAVDLAFKLIHKNLKPKSTSYRSESDCENSSDIL
ncbi:MAG TPA: TIGR00725 family protein [Methanosarcinales archaeon]|nr:TIGR00725 family protein [Methanosarcinales archaeon]